MPTTHFVPLLPPLAQSKEGVKTITNVSILKPIFSLVVVVLPWEKDQIVPSFKELGGWVVSGDNARFTRVPRDTSWSMVLARGHKQSEGGL
jgi:hypothetical protein